MLRRVRNEKKKNGGTEKQETTGDFLHTIRIIGLILSTPYHPVFFTFPFHFSIHSLLATLLFLPFLLSYRLPLSLSFLSVYFSYSSNKNNGKHFLGLEKPWRKIVRCWLVNTRYNCRWNEGKRIFFDGLNSERNIKVLFKHVRLATFHELILLKLSNYSSLCFIRLRVFQ